MSFSEKIPIHGGGCKIFTVLCSLGKLADSTLSIYMIKKGVVFNSDHLDNFQFRSPGQFSIQITSQNVMDLSIGIILPGFPGILHLPSCMDRPWI